MPDDEVVSSENKKYDDWIPLQELIKDKEIPSEDLSGFERIPPKCKVSHNEVCLFEEVRDIFLFNKRKSRPQY